MMLFTGHNDKKIKILQFPDFLEDGKNPALRDPVRHWKLPESEVGSIVKMDSQIARVASQLFELL